ncbi:8852_t:CDS:2, partial [Dentiscutata erythropus]
QYKRSFHLYLASPTDAWESMMQFKSEKNSGLSVRIIINFEDLALLNAFLVKLAFFGAIMTPIVVRQLYLDKTPSSLHINFGLALM